MERVNSKLANAFLNNAKDVDLINMKHRLNISTDAKHLFTDSKLSKEEFCNAMHIKPNKLASFLKGTFNYTLKELCAINALYIKINTEKLKEQTPIKVG